MSLRITNKATPKQVAILGRLEYTGNGKYAAENLTTTEAGKIIDELITEQRWTLKQIEELDYYDSANKWKA